MTATQPQGSTSAITQVYGKLRAQDVERARIFSAEKLGLTPFWERAQHLHYKVGGAHSIIYPAGAWQEDASIRGRHELGAPAELRRQSQVLTIELAGGSGYGSPAGWPAGEVERDLSEGFITEAGLADYGREPGREA